MGGHSQKWWSLIDHGIPKSGVSHKWWIEQIDWMIFPCWYWWNNFWFDGQSTWYLWHVNAVVSLQVLEIFFLKNSIWTKKPKYALKWPQNRVFRLFWKILSLVLLETFLNKTWSCYLFYSINLISGETVLEL